MTELELMELLSELPAEYVQAAEHPQPRRVFRFRNSLMAAAACVLLAVSAAVIYPHLRMNAPERIDPPVTTTATTVTETSAGESTLSAVTTAQPPQTDGSGTQPTSGTVTTVQSPPPDTDVSSVTTTSDTVSTGTGTGTTAVSPQSSGNTAQTTSSLTTPAATHITSDSGSMPIVSSTATSATASATAAPNSTAPAGTTEWPDYTHYPEVTRLTDETGEIRETTVEATVPIYYAAVAASWRETTVQPETYSYQILRSRAECSGNAATQLAGFDFKNYDCLLIACMGDTQYDIFTPAGAYRENGVLTVWCDRLTANVGTAKPSTFYVALAIPKGICDGLRDCRVITDRHYYKSYDRGYYEDFMQKYITIWCYDY